jgi:hypothetical protein
MPSNISSARGQKLNRHFRNDSLEYFEGSGPYNIQTPEGSPALASLWKTGDLCVQSALSVVLGAYMSAPYLELLPKVEWRLP